MEITEKQFVDCLRANRQEIANRIRADIKRIIGTDHQFDCGDNIIAKVMQQRLMLVLEAVEDLQKVV